MKPIQRIVPLSNLKEWSQLSNGEICNVENNVIKIHHA